MASEETYGNLENLVSVIDQTFTVSRSESTISSKCVVMAAPSVAGLEPAVPTRSVMSKMILVKPSLSK